MRTIRRTAAAVVAAAILGALTPPPPLISRAWAQQAGCPTPTSTITLGGTPFISEAVGGLRDHGQLDLTINPALTADSFVDLTFGRAQNQTERTAIFGQDFRMQRRARLPAGATSVAIPVYSAGRDFTADGDAEMAVGLAYPTDRVWTNNGCLPYTIGEVDSEVTLSDSSKPIPQNCKTNVRFEVDRQHFSMSEGDTVNYSIYLSGPEPTPASFPIVVLWQIEESKDYNTILARAGTGENDVVFTAEDWKRRNGKPVTLTISDPDNNIDGDGEVLVAHHVSVPPGGDTSWSSDHCLQTPEALAMTQMRVKVTDSGQQCTNCARAGDLGSLKRPDHQDGDPTPVTTTTLPVAGQSVEPQSDPDPDPDAQPKPAAETEPYPRPQTQQPPRTAPQPDPQPTDETSEVVQEADERAKSEEPEPTQKPVTLTQLLAAIKQYQNGEITHKELLTIIHQYLTN